jgi:hypothetical protein
VEGNESNGGVLEAPKVRAWIVVLEIYNEEDEHKDFINMTANI